MIELIAYIVLYGAVMSLLASLVYTITVAARKVNRQALLNRGATMLYTEVLSNVVQLNADWVNNVSINSDKTVISITFEKRYIYDENGVQKSVSLVDDYKNNVKPVKLTYKYTINTDYIEVIHEKMNPNVTGGTSSTTIDLGYNMTITSVNSNIEDLFTVSTKNDNSKYVTFKGKIHLDSKDMEFELVIPVLITNAPDEG